MHKIIDDPCQSMVSAPGVSVFDAVCFPNTDRSFYVFDEHLCFYLFFPLGHADVWWSDGIR